MTVPPMPEGFTDRAAWDAIHWSFCSNASTLDRAVIAWQLENQERVRLAAEAARRERERQTATEGRQQVDDDDVPRPTAVPAPGAVEPFDAGWDAHRAGLQRETVEVIARPAALAWALLGYDCRALQVKTKAAP